MGRDRLGPPLLRGRHSTIYPVELPRWIPSTIVDELDERFRKHLRQEIETMLAAAAAADTRRNRHAAHESESNISVASTNFSIELDEYK